MAIMAIIAATWRSQRPAPLLFVPYSAGVGLARAPNAAFLSPNGASWSAGLLAFGPCPTRRSRSPSTASSPFSTTSRVGPSAILTPTAT
ncbi:MAG: hypothetical protein IBJ17_14515 [Reyranella sp.]|nr:hypothetical protein [Reyranella sp.]